MTAVLLRRAAAIPLLLLVVSVVVFCLPRIDRANATRAVALARSAGAVPDPATTARLEREFGLDRPLAQQYLGWLGGALRGDLGTSYASQTPTMPNSSNEIRLCPITPFQIYSLISHMMFPHYLSYKGYLTTYCVVIPS